MAAPRRVVAVLDDLFFQVKILDAARRAGMDITFVKDEAKLAELAGTLPELILFDLNVKSLDAVAQIQRLKLDPHTAGVRVVGFVAHVQVDVKQAALAAGADHVVARSTFATALPSILQS